MSKLKERAKKLKTDHPHRFSRPKGEKDPVVCQDPCGGDRCIRPLPH